MSREERFDQILSRRLNQTGLRRIASAAYVCVVANELAKGRYEALKFQDGVLTVRATNAIVAQELRMELAQLSTELRLRLHLSDDKKFEIRITLR